MKTLIYQCWDGPQRTGNMYGTVQMEKYAKRIGADYHYDLDANFRTDLGQYSPNYTKFRPVLDNIFYDMGYDYIMYADCDVVPREGLEENIFEQLGDHDIGICEEVNAPIARKRHTIGGGINNANDEKWVDIIEKKWPVTMPRTMTGLPKVYNSGMLLWSKNGIEKARKELFDFAKYVKLINAFKLPSFYTCDQPYIHAMLEVCHFDWKVMPYKWNSSVHYDPAVKTQPRPIIDLRKENCNFVHIQINGADNFRGDKINRIVNLPVEEWDL